jgi:hypothetical protein
VRRLARAIAAVAEAPSEAGVSAPAARPENGMAVPP